MNDRNLDQRIAQAAPLTDAELEHWDLAAPLSNLCEAIMSNTHTDDHVDQNSQDAHLSGGDDSWSPFTPEFDTVEPSKVRTISNDELREHAARRRRLTTALAGVASVAVLVVGLAFAINRPTPSPVAEAPSSALPAVDDATNAAPVCDDTGCFGLDELPVSPGLTDYYAGPTSLGEPSNTPQDLQVRTTIPGRENEQVSFFNGIRCAELDAAGTTCVELDGLTYFGGLVQYDTDITVDTTGTRTSDSFSIQINTSWTDLTPEQLITSTYGPETAIDDARTVRGHPAVYTDYISPSLVWQERPGVLVSVQVPTERQSELDEIAENIRLVEGPTTISSRVAVPGTGDVVGATGDRFNTLTVERGNGVECVGWAFAQSCDTDIAATTFRESTSDGPAIIGATPSDVTAVRLTVAGETLTTIDTRSFGTYESRFFKVDITATGPITVEWLNENQAVVASVLTEPGPDELDQSEG